MQRVDLSVLSEQSVCVYCSAARHGWIWSARSCTSTNFMISIVLYCSYCVRSRAGIALQYELSIEQPCLFAAVVVKYRPWR